MRPQVASTNRRHLATREKVCPSIKVEVDDESVPGMKAGRQYQTRLNPPPGPPADADSNFLPLPEWKPGDPRTADWPRHIHAPREVYDWAKAQGIDWRTLLDPKHAPIESKENML